MVANVALGFLRLAVVALLLGAVPADAQHHHRRGSGHWIPEFDPAAAGAVAALLVGGGVLAARRRR